MKCFHHPEADATGYCRQCGKALCGDCRRDVRGVVYCEDCLATLAAAPAASAPPGASSPGVALALGFIPGVGALYNSEYGKALIHFLIFVAMVSALSSDLPHGLAVMLGLLLAGFLIYMPIEAYHTAKRQAAGLAPASTGWETLRGGSGAQATATGALVLIVLGAVVLMANLNVFAWFDWAWTRYVWRFWPLILIALGIWLLRRRSPPPPR